MATEAAPAAAETERLSPFFLNTQQKSNQRREESILNTEFRTVTNLLFYTDHTTAWHTAVTRHFSYTTKKGICKGRQTHIFEDRIRTRKTGF